MFREVVADNTIIVSNQGTEIKIDDIFTKTMSSARRRFLLEKFTY